MDWLICGCQYVTILVGSCELLCSVHALVTILRNWPSNIELCAGHPIIILSLCGPRYMYVIAKVSVTSQLLTLVAYDL